MPKKTGKTKTENVLTTPIESEIQKLEEGKFRFLFFVMDTKGIPNDTVEYIYQTAYRIKSMGYNVIMLHGEDEFVGVSSWMGEEYAKMTHMKISDGIKVSASDFLIIPELYSNIMYKTEKLPCMRIVLLTNRSYMTDVIQPGATWSQYQIKDCVTMTSDLEKTVKTVFPDIRVSTVRPFIEKQFSEKDRNGRKLFVNLVTSSMSVTNRIVKEFFWRYPMLKWVAFRDIRGVGNETLSESFKESPITVWVDEMADFGYSALKAMSAGNIIIGKVPDAEVEWLYDELGNIRYNGVWFTRYDEVYEVIAGVVTAFMDGEIPDDMYKEGYKTADAYSEEAMDNAIKKVYIDGFVEDRKKVLKAAAEIMAKKAQEEKDNGEKETGEKDVQ